MMRIGNLQKRIRLESETKLPDQAGGYTHEWTTRATIWAHIKPVTGKELLSSGRIENRITHIITARWSDDPRITPDMRIVFDDRVFAIHSVLNEGEKNEWAVILAEEGAAL